MPLLSCIGKLKMMKTAHVILDRSGSMQATWSDTIGAINEYIANTAKTDPDTELSVTVFDSEGINTIRSGISTSCTPIGVAEVSPRGGTPLFDAVGVTVSKMKLSPKGTDDRRTIIVMTDGQENTSKEWTLEKVRSLLDECKAANWLVIFLGTDLASWAQGSAMGINAVNTAQFNAAAPQYATRSAHAAQVRYTSALSASSGIQDAAFTSAEMDSMKAEETDPMAGVTITPASSTVAPTTTTPPLTNSGGLFERKW